jgi:hypothetical protein
MFVMPVILDTQEKEIGISQFEASLDKVTRHYLKYNLGVVDDTCNPSFQEVEVGRLQMQAVQKIEQNPI